MCDLSSVTITIIALVRITTLIHSPSARRNCSVCSGFVDVHTTSSSQVQSSQLCHLEIHFLFTKGPSARRFLFASLESEKVFIEILCHLRCRKTAHFFTDSPKQILKSEPFSQIPESGSTSFQLSQHTVAPHVLSPVLVLTFSSHLCTNDTLRRNHRMSLDLRPRLLISLSISTLLLS